MELGRRVSFPRGFKVAARHEPRSNGAGVGLCRNCGVAAGRTFFVADAHREKVGVCPPPVARYIRREVRATGRGLGKQHRHRHAQTNPTLLRRSHRHRLEHQNRRLRRRVRKTQSLRPRIRLARRVRHRSPTSADAKASHE